MCFRMNRAYPAKRPLPNRLSSGTDGEGDASPSTTTTPGGGARPRAGFSETVVVVTPKRATTLPRRPQAVTRSECAPEALWIRRRVR